MDSINKFINSLERIVQSSTILQSKDEIIDLTNEILKMLKNEKNDPDSERLINLALDQIPKTSEYQSGIRVLKCHLLFRNQRFSEFRSIWTEINEEPISKIDNSEIRSLFVKYCVLWEQHLKTINLSADLERKVIEGGYSNLKSMFELAELLENVNIQKSCDLLLKITETDKTWNGFVAPKKLILLIEKIKSDEQRAILRRKISLIMSEKKK